MIEEKERSARVRGYQIWQESGSTHGHDREDWNKAEIEIEAAEISVQKMSDRQGDAEPRSDTSAFPWTPVELFYIMAQIWIETGQTLAGMTVWPGLQVRNDRRPTANDAADEAA